ncbi:MAG: hypothetical protein PHQ23_13595, partial [Candidatus Wallbacteria bacterium]|nr:hypothetical protein [Candidatus Wallbacteria bacterium]
MISPVGRIFSAIVLAGWLFSASAGEIANSPVRLIIEQSATQDFDKLCIKASWDTAGTPFANPSGQ